MRELILVSMVPLRGTLRDLGTNVRKIYLCGLSPGYIATPGVTSASSADAKPRRQGALASDQVFDINHARMKVVIDMNLSTTPWA